MFRNVFFSLLLVAASASLAWGADIFSMPNHLRYYAPNVPCTICHKPGAKSIVPPKTVCLYCHQKSFVKGVILPATLTHGPTWPLNHREVAKNQTRTFHCASCHQQAFCLQCHEEGFADEFGKFSNNMINVHLGDFLVTHPIMARTDPQLCSSCHESAFCSNCHSEFRQDQLAGVSHRRTWDNLAVGDQTHADFTTSECQECHQPGSVLPAHEWADGHAREARKNLVTCQACHPEGQVCLKCHSARSGLMIDPHPSNWDDIKDRLNDASNGRTCRMCH